MSRLQMHRFPLAVVALAAIPALTIVTARDAAARPVTAYVANALDHTVTPVDLSTNTAGAAIPVDGEPAAIAITPDASKAYVANVQGNSVTPIDLATNTASPAIPVGFAPNSIAISPDGRIAWVANVGNGDPVNGPFSSLTPIDTVTNTAGPTIPVPNPNAQISAANFVNVSPDGTTLYVTGDTYVTPFDLVSATFGTPKYNVCPFIVGSVLSADGARLITADRCQGVQGVTIRDTPAFTLSGFQSMPSGFFALGIGLTPNGATAYVGATGGAVFPFDLGTLTFGPAISVGGSAGAVAITPDGATVIAAGYLSQSVRLVSTATNTAGADIPVGASPTAIAVTPDQAPTARLSVTRAPVGSPTTFDASASTVAFGTIASYAWDFGDGTTEVTATPITTHTYTGGSYTASVTLTSSAGTSTERVFNGQTMARNGGPQARATALGSLAQLGAPVVSVVSPSAGLVAGGASVNVTGSGFTGATAVRFGGVPAASFVVNGDNSITATTPAAVAAGAVDVSVTNSLGVSAITPADRFRYLATVPAVTTACPSGGCIAVFPTAPGVSVSVSASAGCATCNVVGGIEPLGGPKCPGGAAPELQSAAWVQATQNGGAFSKITASVSYAMTSAQNLEDGNLAWFKLVSVCYVNGVPTPVSSLQAAGGRSAAAAATSAPKAVSLKPCSKTKDQPPCLVAKTVTEGVAHVVVQLPGEGATFRIVTPEVKVRSLKPALASRGSLITISGKNMNAATGVVIGGVEAPIIARTASRLQVTVPEDAGSGDVTVLTLSRPVAAPKSLGLVP